MPTPEKIMDRLITFSWQMGDTTDPDKLLVKDWLSQQDILTGYDQPPTPASELMLKRLMVNPLLRGLALVYKNVNPYSHDMPLIERVKDEGKEAIATLQRWAGTNIATDATTVFLAHNQQIIDDYIRYLVPTYILTTWRSARVIDFSDMVRILSDSFVFIEAKDHWHELEDTRLLVIEDLNANIAQYKKLAGPLVSFIKKRARAWRSTVVPILMPPSLCAEAMTERGLTLKLVSEFFASLGLPERDTISHYVYGTSAHVVYLGVDSKGMLAYKKLVTTR